jgi:hypothetical protein
MTDREMLELAAKAAGLKIDKSPHNGGGYHNDGFDIAGKAVLDWHNGTCWGPLTDDGDALRLACDLAMRIFPVARTSDGAACSAVGDGSGVRLSEVVDGSLDTRSATRRAIVLAAAAIGMRIDHEQ